MVITAGRTRFEKVNTGGERRRTHSWRDIMGTFLIAAIALVVAVIGCALVAPSDEDSRPLQLGLDVAPGALKSNN
jgi:hypothetical protein